MNATHRKILTDLVNLPTAPFAEGHVIQYIRQFVERRPALTLKTDRFGNLQVTYAAGPQPKGRRRRPVLFAAHMDHPGFVATRMVGDGRLDAAFHGWVRRPYFEHAKIQFFSEGRWVPGRIVEVVPHKITPKEKRDPARLRLLGKDSPPKSVIVKVPRPVVPGSPGMWGLPDARIKADQIHARFCDDIAGLAAILCMLDTVCRRRMPGRFYCFFTRAEEVGFAGALAAVSEKTVPRDALVVAVECSKAVTGVQLGAGPVLRVGDKASVFTPRATQWCQDVADRLAKRDKTFIYQRKLMDGGTCESTAYCYYGYDATGICLPLGNYHNMDEQAQRIAPEYIDLRDFEKLVRWFVELANTPVELEGDGKDNELGRRLRSLLKTYRPMLLK